MNADVFLPSRLRIGGGSLAAAAGLLAELQVRRPLILTDAFLAGTGPFRDLLAGLEAAGLHPGVFAEVTPDPTSRCVLSACSRFREGNHDGLIGFGGGSPIDAAKAVNLVAGSGLALADLKVPAVATSRAVPLLAIPTTAGTGSEVTRFTVITDEARNEKMLIAGPACVPSAAIVDYELTLTSPFRLTADTGIDSLTHALEATVSRRRNPFSTGMAALAMGAIARHLRRACAEPSCRPAREAMMLAATQAGVAFSAASVCLVHGMSRPIGAFFHVPHGLSNAMLLPLVTRFSLPQALPEYAQCARTMGWAREQDADEEAANLLVRGLSDLNRDLQVPTPALYGIPRQEYVAAIPTMADQALASGSPAQNPRVPTRDELIELYRAAYGNA